MGKVAALRNTTKATSAAKAKAPPSARALAVARRIEHMQFESSDERQKVLEGINAKLLELTDHRTIDLRDLAKEAEREIEVAQVSLENGASSACGDLIDEQLDRCARALRGAWSAVNVLRQRLEALVPEQASNPVGAAS